MARLRDEGLPADALRRADGAPNSTPASTLGSVSDEKLLDACCRRGNSVELAAYARSLVI